MSIKRLEALVVQWNSDGDSRGIVALKALEYCRVDNLSPPDWVLDAIVQCWQSYSEGPRTGWWGDDAASIRVGDLVVTLDEAFGADRSRPSAKQSAQVKWYGHQIDWYIGQGLPRNSSGYAKIAELIGDGITEAQVRRISEEYQRLKLNKI